MASADRCQTWNGGERGSVVGNDRSAVFTIGFKNESDNPKERKIPERLRNYESKKLTAEDIAQKQRLAEERKEKHDENKARQARKVSEEAIAFDKKFHASLQSQPTKPSNKKWYSHAMK